MHRLTRIARATPKLTRQYTRRIGRDPYGTYAGCFTNDVSALNAQIDSKGNIHGYNSSFGRMPLTKKVLILQTVHQIEWNNGYLQVRTEIDEQNNFYARLVYLNPQESWLESSAFPINAKVVCVDPMDKDITIHTEGNSYLLRESCIVSLF